jgi:hypothetical protein
MTFTGQAWLALPLTDTLTPSAISEHVVRWPATQSIEIRRCRCGRGIARKALGEGVPSTACSLAARAEAPTPHGEDSA